jgi:hypothetical protein
MAQFPFGVVVFGTLANTAPDLTDALKCDAGRMGRVNYRKEYPEIDRRGVRVLVEKAWVRRAR